MVTKSDQESMSFFLTATDTGVGKTTTAAMLLLNYPELLYWKPVQTGNDIDRLNVKKIMGDQTNDQRFLPESYSFPTPVSPHQAADKEGKEIQLSQILNDLKMHQKRAPLLIEGAGGLLVPLTRKETWADFLVKAKLAVIIVARTSLGTINHSLLTIEACQKRNIPILGLIFCGEENEYTCRTICDFTGISQLCSFDFQKQGNLKSVDCQSFTI